MIPIMQPTLPAFDAIADRLREIMANGWITNGKYVEEFENSCADYLEVAHVVAVSSGTMALIAAVKCLDLTGEVIIPSFTWCASAHALLWNNVKPVFVDIDLDTFNIDISKVEAAINPSTSAILAVHMFGNPCDHVHLRLLADKYGLEIIYDSAHAFGSSFGKSKLGDWGTCSTYSLSPSKMITTGEGGLVATSNRVLAEKIRLFRNQGVVNYDSHFLGANARMTEMQAIIGIAMLPQVDFLVKKKNELLETYIPALEKVPGIRFQKLHPDAISTFKDFNIVIDEIEFGMSRDQIIDQLKLAGITTKTYYCPPVHAQKAYEAFFEEYDVLLPNTNALSYNTLTLPLYPDMPISYVKKVISSIQSLRSKKRSEAFSTPNEASETL